MALVQKTFIDHLAFLPDGQMEVRMKKAIVDDTNDRIVSYGYHRFALSPDQDLDQMLATVDAHLPKIDAAPVGDHPEHSVLTRGEAKGLRDKLVTPAVKARFAQKQAQRNKP